MDAHPTRSIAPPEHCAECGFVAATITTHNGTEILRNLGDRYRDALREEPDAVLRRRPNARTWSALEYTAHARDVIALWGGALHLALTKEDPELPRPDRDLPDRTASESSYNTQDPSTVAHELSSNAERMAKKAGTIGDAGWNRSVRLGDVQMSALDIVRKVAHEGHHHLLDVSRSIEAARRNESREPGD